MVPSPKLLSAIGVAAVVAGITVPALALNFPLSSTAIRDAYFIGSRNDQQTADFLAQYAHQLRAPKTGPYVNEIGLDTPFTQVIRHTQGTANYNAPDAVEEFQHKALSLCVHVDIEFTPSYSPVPQQPAGGFYQWVPDFWNDFKVRLMQDGKQVPAQHVRGGPIFSYGEVEIPVVTGARIELEYDPEKIEPGPVKIKVLTPDGQKVETTFDLARLR
jgi:hypothetical protein